MTSETLREAQAATADFEDYPHAAVKRNAKANYLTRIALAVRAEDDAALRTDAVVHEAVEARVLTVAEIADSVDVSEARVHSWKAQVGQ